MSQIEAKETLPEGGYLWELGGVYVARQTNGGKPKLREIRLFFDPNRVSPAVQQGRNQRVPDEDLVANKANEDSHEGGEQDCGHGANAELTEDNQEEKHQGQVN